MATLLCTTLAWSPTTPINWQGATRHGALFDPLNEFGPYTHPEATASPRPLLLSLPGLDGHPLTAFVQFPTLAAEYDVQQWWPDRSNPDAGGDHGGLVSDVSDYIVEASRTRPAGVYLMGESFGGVQALAVAMKLREAGQADALRGIVAVNPATSYPRTDLPAMAEKMQTMPAWRFALESAKIFTTLAGDPQQVRTILSTIVDNPINDPERTPPELAGYLNDVIPAFVEGFSTPRDYFLARLASIGPAAEAVNAGLEAEGAAALGGVPLLVLGGTVDKLALSNTELPRLQKLIGEETCTLRFVEGAGHSGTLDDRCDLREVMSDWRRLRGGASFAAAASSAPPAPSAAATGGGVGATLRWVDDLVIGKSLCPWAIAARQGPMRLVTVADASGFGAAAARAAAELSASTEERPTTLLVLDAAAAQPDVPSFARIFRAAREAAAAAATVELDLLAFHPTRVDSGPGCSEDAADAAHFSVRSPLPTLQLLRKGDLDEARREWAAAHPSDPRPGALGLLDDNKRRLRALGGRQLVEMLLGWRIAAGVEENEE